MCLAVIGSTNLHSMPSLYTVRHHQIHPPDREESEQLTTLSGILAAGVDPATYIHYSDVSTLLDWSVSQIVAIKEG